jgi:hypothetical protein
MALMAYRQKKLSKARELLSIYLSYILYMQNDNGTFRNLLSYTREYVEEVYSEDTFGRTIWALGYLIYFPPNDAYFEIAKEIFYKSLPNFEKLSSPRGIANTCIGICYYLRRFPEDGKMKGVLKNLVSLLVNMYNREKEGDWHWFEPILAYDNGIIPLSLYHAYEILGDKNLLTVALESTRFLEKVTFKEQGYISPVGSDNWYKKGEKPSRFSQQPLDVMAMVLMFHQAYLVTNNKNFLKKMFTSYMWFLGENDLNIPLYDFETRGCSDGLERCGVNLNQGAESIISYKIAHLAVLLAHEQESRDLK